MENQPTRGCFFAFEGIDGSGKSTQSARLLARLRREGLPCYGTCEPTGAPIGAMIRQFLNGRIRSDNKVIAALFVADRLDHLLNENDGILQKVAQGIHVVTDRYYFSSYAYQSVDLPMEWLIEANSQAAALLRPTATVFIDVSPETALDRIARGRFSFDLFETKERLTQTREKFFEAFDRLRDTERVLIVNGDQPEDAIEAEIWAKLQPFFGA